MIVISMALFTGISATAAQEQENKLVDRLLRPNMSLVNSAQNKQFRAAASVLPKRAPSKNFYTPDKSLAKSSSVGRAYSPGKFPTGYFRAGDVAANVPTGTQLTKTDPVPVAPSGYATRVAPENDRSLTTTPFAGGRPFLGQGKSQKVLSAQDTPLTVEQVRELLNKNK